MPTIIQAVNQLINTTVRLECSSPAGISYGSGYFYGVFRPDGQVAVAIITNKHVVKGATRCDFRMKLIGNAGPSFEHEGAWIENLQAELIFHPDPNVDLVAILQTNVVRESNKKVSAGFLSASNFVPELEFPAVSPLEEVIMIGYPNGLWDKFHDRPLIRRGITATDPLLPLNGKPEFLIDAACFPGSSGSPVFRSSTTFEHIDGQTYSGPRFHFLGTLYAGPQYLSTGNVRTIPVPTALQVVSEHKFMMNLGYIIQARQLLIMEPLILERLLSDPSSRNFATQ